MDGIPVQIIDIEKDQKTRKSTYSFKFNALHSILSQVNDIEVAVISIAGPSRQGKSFLLSYLLRYLSNVDETRWIGEADEPLKGFKWNHGIEPETKGVWIWSKPIIVKQSIGKEMAIIIMDTQGVYDEYTDLRDWSTIVGITLLTSSYFIFNVFTDIQENVLTQLETFMNYGLLAMNKDKTNKPAFQRLLFLIRDWNHVRDFPYGYTGGKQYITQKLSIKNHQSQQSQRTRQLISRCFEDVSCYLMPEPGPEKDEKGFDGSSSQLSPKFVSKLNELFSVLLNYDSLKPKVINGNTVTGRDLLKFFQVFDEKFNGDELPQPMDLVESVAKATDLNLISKLKTTYVSEMNKKLNSLDKHFLSKNEIEVLNKDIRDLIDKEFDTSKKSMHHDIVKQIKQFFEKEMRSAYEKFNSKNEEKREKTAKDTIVKCKNIYHESMNKFMTENNFVKEIFFDKQSLDSKNLAKKHFTEIFGDGEVDTYSYSLKINESIEDLSISFKLENQRRKSNYKNVITQAIDDSLTLYCEKIMPLFEEKVFLTPEMFSQYEEEIRSQVNEYFAKKCSGDQDFVNKYHDSLKFKLNDKKSELEALNRKKMKEIIDKTEIELNLALDYCKQSLNETLENFSGSENLNQINGVIKENTIEMFEHNCIVKESQFLSTYMNKLQAEIDKVFVKFTNDFKAKTEDVNDFYKDTVKEAMNKFFVKIEGKSLLSDEDSITFREKLIKEIIQKYKNIPKKGKFDEIIEFVVEKTTSAADLLLIDRLIRIYNQKMTEILQTKTFFSREELSHIHSENRRKVIKIFKAHNKTLNSQRLEELTETAIIKFMSENDIKISEAKRKNLEAVNKSLDYYSDQIKNCLKENLFHSKESFKLYEKDVRKESYKRFKDNCKHEEMEFTSQFELDLNYRIKLLKTEFKANFCKAMEKLESKVSIKINDALSQYNEVIYQLLDNMKSEQQFISKHEEVKEKIINKFKQKCSFKDDEYRDIQISKLENAINDSHNGYHERLLNHLKKYDIIYKKNFNESFELYVELMKDLLKENTSISEEELKNLHQNVVKNVLSKFEKSFRDGDDSSIIESNRRELEIKIKNEFKKIKKTNRMRNESNERSDKKLKLEIQNYVMKYEERMEKIMLSCGNESDLLKQHLQNVNTIKEDMIASNPSLNLQTLNPYLVQLELEVNKSYNDLNLIFQVNLENKSLLLQTVIINARKFYREEMQKYYANTTFLKLEQLVHFNSTVTDRTINKYQSERGNMSVKEFGDVIKDSLKAIYNDFVKENAKNTPTSPSIGIDLGTTNSCVAYYQQSKGRTVIVPNELGNNTTPSVVGFTDNNEEVIGESAKDQSYRNSRNTIYSAKRLIGRKFNDKTVQNDKLLWPFKVVNDRNNTAKICVKVKGEEKVFFPEEISAKILKKLKQMAEKHLGCEVKNAVITVPAYFNEGQKEATKHAGRIAGLNVLKIINEPTAAAIAFQLNRSDELDSRKVLIFDFGGGTLDVVVLAIENGAIDVKAVGGDNHLGGDDIDAKLVDFCLKDFSTKTMVQIDKTSEEGENALRRLTTECEKRKKQLSTLKSVTICVDHFYKAKDLKCELTREKFEELNHDLFVKSSYLVSKVLSDAKLKNSEIDDVVLVGGTTRIPQIQELLSELFDGKPLNHSVNPDEAVAVGAAIQAAILNGNLAQRDSYLSVSEVTPMSLGIEVVDGFMSVIIPRNSKVPDKYTKIYHTAYNNQKSVAIDIYEGEEKMAKHNRKLGAFTLSNVPPGRAGQQKIEVNFNMNDEGILHVKAKIMSNGKEEDLFITEYKGRLTEAELKELIDKEN